MNRIESASHSASHLSQAPMMRFAWRNLWRNPRRTLILWLVFTLGIGTMLFFQSLMQAWSISMLDNALDNLTDPIQIHQPAYRDDPVVTHHFQLTPALQQALEAQPVEWSQRVRVPAMIQSEYESYPVTLVGILPSAEHPMSFIGKALIEGEGLTDDAGARILLGQKLVTRLQTQLNRRVVLMAQTDQDRLGETGLRVSGIFHHADPKVEESLVFVPLSTAQALLKLQNGVHEVAIKLTHGQDRLQIEQVQAALAKTAPNLAVEAWWQLQPYIEASTQMMDSFIWVWLGFIMMLMVFGMLNTLMMSLYERQKEFVLLHTLGMRAGLIRRLLWLEMVWLVSLSALSGAALAALIVWLGRDGISLTAFAEGAAWLGASNTLYLTLDLAEWFEVLGVTLLVIALFSFWPVWRATRHRALRIR